MWFSDFSYSQGKGGSGFFFLVVNSCSAVKSDTSPDQAGPALNWEPSLHLDLLPDATWGLMGP